MKKFRHAKIRKGFIMDILFLFFFKKKESIQDTLLNYNGLR